jgi:sulfide:quinone oxidoreductase
VKGTVTAVDAIAHEVLTAGGMVLGYERLLLAPGARLSLPYANTRTLGFGVLPETLAGSGSLAIVVPAGVSWTLPAYELALLSAGYGRDVRVITAETSPLEAFGPATRTALMGLLDRHRVAVEAGGAPPVGAPLDELADTVIALPLLHGPAITGVPYDAHGFIPVDPRMAVPGVPDAHAAGDAARHRIKQGGLAAQQADVAAAEIARSCGIASQQGPYAPVLRGKLSIPDGEELYLRRHLDGRDDGQADHLPLWQPAGVVCAWRLARWLSHRRGELQDYTLDHVAQPTLR